MKLDFDFFDIAENQTAESGKVLISEPFLEDNYFKRSVVYLTEHNENASIGFVLNKTLKMGINEVISDFPETDFHVSIGGPVSTNSIHYLHTIGEMIPESVHVKNGIFWGGDFDALKKMITDGNVKPEEVRFFLGYSGWGENQLDDELKAKAWLVGDISSELIMKGGDSSFWTEVVSKSDAKYKAWANFPDHPGLN
jgi:putative transcriptional regulator